MQSLLKKARNIKMLVLDVDGVLSNGQIIYDANGVETKTFNVQDGFGMKRLQEFGIKIAIITGRNSQIVANRAKELGVDFLVQGREDKIVALSELLENLNIGLTECAYMGDDLPDIKALQAVGFAATVPNAHSEVIKRVDMITTRNGGEGAVREVCDIILKATDNYDKMLAKYAD
ncbi:phosphatase [Moraxella macacae 0408225]|uniref:3-deoxy-D-manno-octulosonate 8-phosphate phosphatase KdsC n=1 Tax=Moraxella macacae 0408225 TaxID=1230338 RepID=L2F8R4_9GAMM|nr:HAD-IIIA family hydrolase [Moraxella macacae]ELA08863.1 phosphatase [Moraxella macacae 0408225]